MAINFPGPYEVQINYTSGGNGHIQRVNCDVAGAPDPGDAASTIDLVIRSGPDVQLDTAVADWCDLLAAVYPAASSFDNFTLWRYDEGTFDKVFISTALLTIPGTGGGAATESHQLAHTFRTIEGGTMRIVLLESQSTTEDRTPYAGASVPSKAIMDFVVSTDNWILARDTSYPIASLNTVGGQNEALFKKAHR